MQTSMATMTSRERILATLRRQEVDRFPVWLKMGGPWLKAQPAPYNGLPPEEILRQAGCDMMLGAGLQCRESNPHVEVETTESDGRRRCLYHTPDGDLVDEKRFDAASGSWHPTKFVADTVENFRRMRWLYTDTTFEVNEDDARGHARRQREMEAIDAVTMISVRPSPLMNLMQHLCGPENAIYFAADEPEMFDEVLELMHQQRLRRLRTLLPHVKADTFWMSENTSTTLISPTMFERICMPHLRAYADLIHEHDVLAVYHMCGKLDALLELIDTLPADANEAFTSPPVGDTTLTAGRTRMPSKCLIGGTNAALWLRQAEEIIAEVAADVAACPDRRGIFLTSAGVLPPAVSFEKAHCVIEAFKTL